MQFGGTILEGSLNSARRENGFSYGGGNQRVTEGIWLWSKPFIIPDPSTAGGKLCVLLMDTQGMWDGQTGQGLTTSIFGLSTLLSSYQIYNVQNRLQEDQLQHLAMFSEYSLKISEVKSPSSVMAVADKEAMVLHCLPVHRGEEVTEKVFEAHAQEIFDEAENRLHAQKAVLCKLLK